MTSENIILILWLSLLALLTIIAFFGARRSNAQNRRQTLIFAIFLYQWDCLIQECEPKVLYSDMEDFNKTVWRLLDWSYENILPPDKFRIVQPYLVRFLNDSRA